jgi:hypothetical protein
MTLAERSLSETTTVTSAGGDELVEIIEDVG